MINLTDKLHLHNCDNMELMRQTPDKYYDLAIVDPPYGNIDAIGLIDNKKKGKQATKRTNYKLFENIAPDDEYYCELARVSKNQIIWGGNYFSDYLKPHGGWIVWEKGVPEGMSLSQAELAWNSCLNSVRIVKVLWAGYKKADNEDRFHPTQKPVRLYDWLLMNFAKEGDLILDTHLGSGSSRIAAYKGGFNFVGFEIDSEYYQKQEKRFNEFKSQLRLF